MSWQEHPRSRNPDGNTVTLCEPTIQALGRAQGKPSTFRLYYRATLLASIEFPLSFHATTSHPRFPKVTGYYSSSTHTEISAGKAVLHSRYNRDPAREWRCCRMYNKWFFPGAELKTKDTRSNRRVRRTHFSQNNTK